MEVDIVYGLAIAAAVIFTVAQVARIIRAAMMHKTLRKSIEKGQALDPELIDGLDHQSEPGSADQRIGFVLVSIALALIAAGAINFTPDTFRAMTSIALFPLFVGGALLLRLRWSNQGE